MCEETKNTVRLHPRRAHVLDVTASKLGGVFLWPSDEPWPVCKSPNHYNGEGTAEAKKDVRGKAIELVPVLQLRSEDFPEVQFFPGSDLLQLMWCPLEHGSDEGFVAKTFIFWRKRSEVRNPLEHTPKSPFASKWYLPNECELHPERVKEFFVKEITQAMCTQACEWLAAHPSPEDIRTEDEWLDFLTSEHALCPSNKVGGYPKWVQGEEIPTCKCGNEMEYLLTLTDCEFDGGDWRRWCPIEDHAIRDNIFLRRGGKSREEQDAQAGIVDPANFNGFGAGELLLFICRTCKNWPIQSVFQR
ncbi:DUF1963 domain-containing protein [Telmatocola sphagniphila]|uniref:DUF1963 domain-containing protein n=1 Tax=Telmatocola sphagniphila TaxID=1123043 RepID=A0A8E6EVK6_9BACT|nr:DUF1963 domain-containing protein [Telmatocola sphagniphila]QVL32722.1 DUF1963 domain-containing protein [Telmatocola sphagniphila]